MTKIEIQNLTKVIKGNTVLKEVHLLIDQPLIYGFVGRNGAGKTMLFRAISGLIAPTSGSIFIDGKLLGKEISFPPSLGITIENVGLWPEFSGFKNLKMLAKINRKIDDEQIKAAIARVGLDPEDKRPVRKYSQGMKQRIVLAQALMESPELIILDEPTNALDEKGVELIRNILLEEKARGATILISSHSREDIEILCDIIYHMDGGKIIDIEQRTEKEEDHA